MHPHLAENPDFVARFVGEARAAARLSHPHVVAVHDQGTDGSDVFLVMELVIGTTLRDVLRARGRLSPAEALDVLEPMLDALGAAHRAGLVHRDVKPENVLITPDGRVKVADFGLARATSTVTNATQGVLIGTVAYLSPEQVEHGRADVRSDVYGAGVVLYEMLTGEPPFTGDNPLAVAYRHVHEDVPAPSLQVPGTPAALDALVAGATARDPEHRYRDADGFLSAARATRSRMGLPLVGAAPFVEQAPVYHDTLIVASPLIQPTASPHDTGVLDRTPALSGGATPPTEPAPFGPPRKRRGRGLLILIALLAVIAGTGYAAWAFGTTPQATVPGVIGQTRAAAEADLASAGFGTSFTPAVFSETVKAGRVVRTSPAPGTQADQDSTVAITLSKGAERYAVPDVVGRTSSDARKALNDSQLTLGDTPGAFSNTLAKGLVISTNPKAGTKLKKDSLVNLTISKGPKPIAVPKVTGKQVAQAKSQLAAIGLTATSTEAFSSRVAKGVVISQSPSGGTLPPRGQVALVVSKGPAPVPVPNVVNLKLAQARQALQAAGFVVVVRNDIPGGPGIVLQQSPGAGASRAKGSTVSLDVF
jgi:serine/threonine-protein kinase